MKKKSQCVRLALCAASAFLGIGVASATSATDVWDIHGSFGRVEGAVAADAAGHALTNAICRVETRETRDAATGVTSRRTTVTNVSGVRQTLRGLLDRFTLDGGECDVYTQYNIWHNESRGAWQPLVTGVDMRSGLRSTGEYAPMLAIWNRPAGRGRVYHLLPESAWQMRVARRQHGDIVVETGLDGRYLDYPLAPGEQVSLPEVLYYDFTNRTDFDCHRLHAYWNRRSPGARQPAVYNTWLYRFDRMTADGVLEQVKLARELGLEYFVLDAGWFGPKKNWTTVRGDWDEQPDGALEGRMLEISKAVRAAGMKFGFWVEAECADAGAKVVQAHPDWYLTWNGNRFLDFENPEAFNWLLEKVCALVARHSASYLKFDFNQNHDYDRSGRAFAGYLAGYRRFVESVRARNPGIYIEGCASGGMMCDLGWAKTFDSFWPTDNQGPFAGMRLVKDTMVRLPPRLLDRWITARSAPPLQPDINGRDGARLLATDDACWLNMRTVSHRYLDAFTAGGAFCLSCDLTAFSTNALARFRETIAARRAEREFWLGAVGRILCDTPTLTVLQYSDERFDDVRLVVAPAGALQNDVTLHPVLDPAATYAVQGAVRTAADIAERGIVLPVGFAFHSEERHSGVVTLTRVKAPAAADYPIRDAEMRKVHSTAGFWHDRVETNRTATLASNWAKCAETPRIANFTNAALRAHGTFGGIPFDDSDVFKVIEGTAYILAEHPDPARESFVTWLNGQIARAQEPDGYLYTARTLGFRGNPMVGPTRWSAIPGSHELYNVGHLYEAAVAWRRATGHDDLLRVAEKNAALIARTFGPDDTQLKDVPGHEEIEIGLGKLYRETGKKVYLDLLRHFIEQKGRRALAREATVMFNTEGELVSQRDEIAMPDSYRQNHLPVAVQRSAVGHAVRAMYLYCGVTDLAVFDATTKYDKALDAIWNDIVASKLHLTGGIGARPNGEAFGQPYELPNDYGKTYLETCAAIGLSLWNDRLFRRSGDAKYVDVLERTLYNGFVSGISLSGDEYFYPNPLASKGGYKRSKWFHCSCCPVNDIRFIPQVPAMAYATDGKDIYWNLFMASEAEVNGVKLAVKTEYPWRGEIAATVTPKQAGDAFALKIRIPGWARGRPVPSDLYAQTAPSSFAEVAIEVNGKAVDGCPDAKGYVTVSRAWQKGDVVRVALPMPVKRIRANGRVAADRGRLAVEKGPIVYCAEGADNAGKAYDAALPADATFTETTLAIGDKTFPALKASNGLTLVPYCLWGNRQPGNELQTWFRE